jgi:steroid delta-isomerase-like uncharacterized protein
MVLVHSNTMKGAQMSNKQIAERLLVEVWNKGNLSLVDELLTADYQNHDTTNPFAEQKGPDGYKKLVGMYLEAFPNTTFTIRDQIESGDKVVTRWTVEGTHKGVLMGIPPTGKDAKATGINIDRFADGKVAESWGNWDTIGMMRQLGVIPEAG